MSESGKVDMSNSSTSPEPLSEAERELALRPGRAFPQDAELLAKLLALHDQQAERIRDLQRELSRDRRLLHSFKLNVDAWAETKDAFVARNKMLDIHALLTEWAARTVEGVPQAERAERIRQYRETVEHLEMWVANARKVGVFSVESCLERIEELVSKLRSYG